ncbi:MAG: tetratricopeptide repeat protein [Deltaproteobacteria bacterium]|jgi:tetratricopeptide (TPR) repeat protein|nr:tetratricopeptide repeat protein [Deltaproteobacteria bacterium]
MEAQNLTRWNTNISVNPQIPCPRAAEAAARGDFRKAANFIERELAAALSSNPGSVRSLSLADSLGEILLRMGKAQEASEVLETALDACLKSLGDDHPGYLKLANNLGCALIAIGEAERAVKLLKHASSVRRKASGPSHLDTLTADNNLGCAYALLLDYKAAEGLFERVAAERERCLGKDDVATVMTRDNLARARKLILPDA